MKNILRRLSRVRDSSQYQHLNRKTKSTTGYSRWWSARVPSGHVPVYVGEDEPTERFVIKAEILCQQAFVELLSQVADEFGYNHSGALQIPCSVSVFEQLISQACLFSGFVCKDPNLVTTNNNFLSGPRKASNYLGSNMTEVSVTNLTGLKTLGISSARFDFGPTSNYHPCATEILVVIEGTLQVVMLNSTYFRLFRKFFMNKGNVYVFLQGVVRFQYNYLSTTSAVAFSFLSSDNREPRCCFRGQFGFPVESANL